METILSSPRSSSGYGSSEEDHGCYGLATTRSSSSAPQTPDSLSPLSSDLCGNDFSVDLQSVFEEDDIIPDIIPDFSDLGTISDANELYYLADDWSTVTTPLTVNSPCASSLCDLTAEDIDHLAQATAETISSDSNILVSLLKRKSEFDWFPTTPVTNDSSDNGQVPLQSAGETGVTSGECVAALPATADATETVHSSPLQRLKALTHGNIVNNTELPGRTRIIINTSNTSTVIRQQTSAPSTSSTGHSNTVIRVGVAGNTPFTAASRPNRTSVLGSSDSQGTSMKSDAPIGRSPVFAVSSACVNPTTNSPSCSEPRSRKTPSAAMTVSSASIRSAPIAIRRHRSELDDHRYSSLLPVPMSSSSSASRRPTNSSAGGATKRLNRSLSTQSNGVSSISRSTNGRKTGSSMLETLLLTSKTLRPNDGSEASLAACGAWSLGRRNSADSGELSPNGPQPKRTCSEAPGSLLEHLLTGRTDESMVAVRAAVIPKTEPVEEDVVEEKLAVDSFNLFGDQLLCDDTHGMNLGGLFGEDISSAWTPACFDDRVFSTELEEIMHQEVRQEDAWLQHYLSDLL